jgi:CBS domain-containing protein
MANRVEEIMNRELFSLRPDDAIDEALEWLLMLGISGAPVTDPYGKPVGMASWRDLLARRRGPTVGDCMSSPAVVVKRGATIKEAAAILSERGFHRVVVVDDTGHAVGVVSTLDVARALLGMPAAHPETFPHFDKSTGLIWSDDAVFGPHQIELAPSAPGILVLRVGGANEDERDVWIEGTGNLRDRLREIASGKDEDRRLALLLKRLGPKLCFRTTVVVDAQFRKMALDRVRASG